MTGGTDKLRYRLSAGFIDNDGVLITDKDKYRRMNVSGFISANVNLCLHILSFCILDIIEMFLVSFN